MEENANNLRVQHDSWKRLTYAPRGCGMLYLFTAPYSVNLIHALSSIEYWTTHGVLYLAITQGSIDYFV